jgi:hypothetical protein
MQKLENLEEMSKFLKTHVPQLNQEEIKNISK